MAVELSTINSKLTQRLARAIRWLAEYLGHHDDHDAKADSYVTVGGHTLWYDYLTGWTQVVADHQIVFEADPDGRAVTFIEGPWIGEILGLAEDYTKGRAA